MVMTEEMMEVTAVMVALEMGTVAVMMEVVVTEAMVVMMEMVTEAVEMVEVIMMEEVILEAPVAGATSISVIPTSSGVHELSRLDPASELRLTQSLQRVCEDADWLFIDTAAGIHDAVLKMLAAAQEVIIVSTPEPTSLLDAYAMLKVLHVREPDKPVHMVINNAQNLEEATEAADQLKAAAQHFLGRELEILGLVPSDRHLLQAVREERSVVDLYPDSPAGTAIRAMAESLAERVGV